VKTKPEPSGRAAILLKPPFQVVLPVTVAPVKVRLVPAPLMLSKLPPALDMLKILPAA